MLRREGVDALLVTSFVNVTYLTGFTGDDSYLLVGPEIALLISDPRYTTQIGEECCDLDVEIRRPGTAMVDVVARVIRRAKVDRVGFEGSHLTVAAHAALDSSLPKTEWKSLDGPVEQLRVTKDAGEVAEIKKAVRWAEKAFEIVRAGLRSEQTEKQVVTELEHQMRLLGAAGASFPPIVAVGERAALPHAPPTDRPIGQSGFVLIDWGATGRLYKSDLTRVLATGKISSKLHKVYEVVLSAQKRALGKIRAGLLASEVDAEARSQIEGAGFGRFFGHGLGHGIGIQIHEAPGLRQNANTPLKAGMVVTVEPGVYLPGWGGVRIEDDVLVTRTGCEVLTSVPKELDEMVVSLL
jgi:Xaa-Pro aminopeptidase